VEWSGQDHLCLSDQARALRPAAACGGTL